MVVKIFKSYQYSNILVSLQARMSDLGIGVEVSFGSRLRSVSSLVKGWESGLGSSLVKRFRIRIGISFGIKVRIRIGM